MTSRGLRRPPARIACLFVLAAALFGATTLVHADEQRVARLGLTLYAMPTSLNLHDVNESIDQLNAITAAEQNPRLRRGMRLSVHRDILDGLRTRAAEASVKAVIAHYAYARERLLAGYRPERVT